MDYRRTNLSDITEIGKRLRLVRGNRKQREISELSGFCIKTISDIENGNVKDIGCNTLNKLCKALNVSVDSIIKK